MENNGESENQASAPPELPPILELRLKYDESSRQLTVALVDTGEKGAGPKVSRDTLNANLKRDGYDKLFALEAGIDQILDLIDKQTPGEVIYAEARDATAELTVSTDKMSAYLAIKRAFGGNLVTRDSIEKLLSHHGIKNNCWLEDRLKELDKKESATNVLVAKGKLPRNGKDSEFRPLFDTEEKSREFVEDASGKIDYLAPQEYLILEAGEKLMERIPPTEGQPGYDLYGNPVLPQKGKVLEYALNKCKGAKLDESDSNILVAEEKGHPVIIDRGVRQDDTLTLKNVSLATGNVEYDGSLEVQGDVQSGLKIDVTGDVFIKGTVENARIHAGGNITVVGGVLGQEVEHDEKMETAELQGDCSLSSEKSISVRYANYSQLTAAGSVEVREYFLHCAVSAVENIFAGQDGGKGRVMGGTLKAGKCITANILGSDAYVKTHVEAGTLQDVFKKLEELQEKASPLKQQLAELTELKRNLIRASEGKMNDTIRAKLKKLEAAIHTIHTHRQEIQKKATGLKQGAKKALNKIRIETKKACYSNVEICINGYNKQIEEDYTAAIFAQKGKTVEKVDK
ncbi:MAG: FapA family protein [Cellvibrionaceae bacterium]